MNKTAPYLLIAFVALMAYGAVLVNGAGFSHPDDVYVAQTMWWGFRPGLVLTYWINRHIGGWMLTNFILHLTSAFLLFASMRRLTSPTFSFLTSCVMVAHPFAADAVASVSGRSGILFALAILTGLRVALWRPWIGAALGLILTCLTYGYIPDSRLHYLPQNDVQLTPPLSQPDFARQYLASVASYVAPRLVLPANLSTFPLIVYTRESELIGWSLLLLLAVIATWPRHHITIRLACALLFFSFAMYAFVPLSDLVMEHRFYLAIVGASILAGRLLIRQPALAIPLVGALILVSNLRTYTYSTGVRLWENAVQQNPMSAHARLDLAGYYAQDDQWARALQEAKNALLLDPDMPLAYLNVASGYLHFSNFSEASRVMDAGDAHFKGDHLWQRRLTR